MGGEGPVGCSFFIKNLNLQLRIAASDRGVKEYLAWEEVG
jgi:hypothetical protein